MQGLVQDLYAAHKDNQTFLHSRFGLGEDVLEPYKQTIDRWLWPDVLRNQDTSVTKAKQAISNYKKAVAESAGLAELMVFYCEQAAGFCSDIGNEDESYFAALVRMFEQALSVANTLPATNRDALVARLDRVCSISHTFGFGSETTWNPSSRNVRGAVAVRPDSICNMIHSGGRRLMIRGRVTVIATYLKGPDLRRSLQSKRQ